MKFGEYLESCIREKNISINGLTKITGINRGGFYNVFKGKRNLKEDKLFSIFDNVGFSKKQEQILTELYFAEFFGENNFDKVIGLIKLLNNIDLKPKTINTNMCRFNKKFCLTEKKEIYSAINFILENSNDSTIITNFNYNDNRIDNLFYTYVKNGNPERFIHVLNFHNFFELRNLEVIFYSLKYMYCGCFPVYKYENKNDQVFPFFIVSKDYALLFNDIDAIFLDDVQAVNNIRCKAEKMAKDCNVLGSISNDIMYIKDLYIKGFQKESGGDNERLIFSSYPCIAPWADFELMEYVTRSELPDKEYLVNIANYHYESLYIKDNYISFFSLTGLERFVETGNVKEIPGEYIRNLNKKFRLQVLNGILEDIKNEKVYIFNDEKFVINNDIDIECCSNQLLFGAFDSDKENFFSYDKFLVKINELDIINIFRMLKEYLIRGRLVYSKMHSEIIVQNLIVKLKNMNIE